jgi:adenosylcobinamide kinase/adenosylcobinamide-phosphate guanylyltransferase
MKNTFIFVLGGARSGKSAYALELIKPKPGRVLFVATATASDPEMATRIASHQADRPAHWITIEAPIRVGKAVRSALPADWIILDCVTLLAGNILNSLPEPVNGDEFEVLMGEEIESLMNLIPESNANWLVISNEVGLGVVPSYPLGRIYRDGLGRANQRLASLADRVLFMTAGIPLAIKGGLPVQD